MHQEITVKNYRCSCEFGWGYTFTPTGEDAYSIEIPTRPDHVGTLRQIQDAVANDKTWQSKDGAFYNTAWFYDGKRIIATWVFDIISQPAADEAANMNTDEFYDACEYGWRWVNGWRDPMYPLDQARPGPIDPLAFVPIEANVKIRVELQILTVADLAREFSITTRRARALAKNRHERFGIGQQLPSGQWVFRPEDLDILRPDPKYRKEK